MDDSVLAAMKRWPDVPAAYGWLSLTARGEWHIHPEGSALRGEPGEPIVNTQLVAFINRNYQSDADGCWYFQNGPQRVYVHLSLAPHILRLSDDTSDLVSHTGAQVAAVQHWWLDQAGRLWAQTDLGPGVILDRDLAAVIEKLTAASGQTLSDLLEEGLSGKAPTLHWPGWSKAAPLREMLAEEPSAKLHFNPDPRAISG